MMIDEQEIFSSRISRWLDTEERDVAALRTQLFSQADFRTPSLVARIVGYMESEGDREIADLFQSELSACLQFYAETGQPDVRVVGSLHMEYYDWLDVIQGSVSSYRDPYWDNEKCQCENKACYGVFCWLKYSRQAYLSFLISRLGLDPSKFLEPEAANVASFPAPIIPANKRTRPMSKTEVARLLGRTGNKKRLSEWTSNCIKDGVIRYHEISRQSGFYHVDDFPENLHERVKPN